MNEAALLREFFSEIPAAPVFSSRKAGIPGEYRLAWRLSLLCLLLNRGRGRALAFDHLHVLWWATRSSRTRELMVRWFRGDKRPDELLVRFDPALSATVDLALGQGLVLRESTGTVRLSEAGGKLAAAIENDASALVAEREFLATLPKSITQRQIRELLEWK